MTWISVSEPHAAPPRTGTPTASVAYTIQSADRGLLHLDGLTIEDEQVSLAECEDLEMTDCRLLNTGFGSPDDVLVEIAHCHLTNCDLSGLKIAQLRTCTLDSTKLVGTDFSDSTITDVSFENCHLRYSDFRMARLERVRFSNCTLDDVDLFESALIDVDLANSSLSEVNIDRVSATRVDLRRAQTLGFTSVGRLTGFLVGEAQLQSLLYLLAAAAGLDIEQSDSPVAATN